MPGRSAHEFRLVVVRRRTGGPEHRRLHCIAVVDLARRQGRFGPGQRRRSRHRSRVGRRPARIRQAAAALVDQPLLPDDPVRHRLPGVVPGHGQLSPAPATGLQWASTTPTAPPATRNWLRRSGPTTARPSTCSRATRRRVALGRALFSNHCATCHGSSAQGAIGYPNLTDKIWQWGGTPDDVLQTVLHGRNAQMPAWETTLTGMGGETAVDDVLTYVLSLTDPSLIADRRDGRGARQETVRQRLRRLSRTRRQGQHEAGRAGPDGRLLAVWSQPRRRARRPAPGAQWPDAGAPADHR